MSSFKYLGVWLSKNLIRTLNTTLVKKAHQRLDLLRNYGMSPQILSNFYSCVVESILTSCIKVRYGSSTATDRKRLQRCKGCVQSHQDSSPLAAKHLHAHGPEESCFHHQGPRPPPARPVPTGQRDRSVKCRTTRLRNTFFPSATTNCTFLHLDYL